MAAAANLVEVAALVGDTARATMLAALMGWQSLTSGELAFLAHVSRSTASEHLAKLVEARLLTGAERPHRSQKIVDFSERWTVLHCGISIRSMAAKGQSRPSGLTAAR